MPASSSATSSAFQAQHLGRLSTHRKAGLKRSRLLQRFVGSLWPLAGVVRNSEHDQHCESVDRYPDDPHKSGPARRRQSVNPTKDKWAEDRRQTDEAGDDALQLPLTLAIDGVRLQ